MGADDESLSGRVNLTERFTDVDESDDTGGTDFELDVSPIKKPHEEASADGST